LDTDNQKQIQVIKTIQAEIENQIQVVPTLETDNQK
jgi:hypothetical protein